MTAFLICEVMLHRRAGDNFHSTLINILCVQMVGKEVDYGRAGSKRFLLVFSYLSHRKTGVTVLTTMPIRNRVVPCDHHERYWTRQT